MFGLCRVRETDVVCVEGSNTWNSRFVLQVSCESSAEWGDDYLGCGSGGDCYVSCGQGCVSGGGSRSDGCGDDDACYCSHKGNKG